MIRARPASNSTKIRAARDVATVLNQVVIDLEHIERSWDTGYLPGALRGMLLSLMTRARSAADAHMAFAEVCAQRQRALEARQ